MNVLFLMTNFPRWEGDVHSPWAVELIQRLRQHDVHVTVCAPSYRGLRDHEIFEIPVKRFRYAPAPWETLTHDSGAPNKMRQNPLYLLLLPGYLLAGIWRVWRLCRSTNWDVVHVHWPIPQGVLALLGCRRRARIISTFYGADLALARKSAGLIALLRRIVARSETVTAISRHTGQTLAELSGVEPAIIPYGIDMTPRYPHVPDRAPGPFEILMVGRLIERKGHVVLIQALAQIAGARDDVTLTIVGEGHERPRLEALIRELGLAERVQLTGRISDDELEQAYARCDIFVLPSVIDSAGDTEGLGMVLLEAMRYEKPVIASDVGGITDIVTHGETGLLTPPSDPAALAGAIVSLLDNREMAERLGKQGRQINAGRFAWDRVVSAYLHLYRSGHPRGETCVEIS
jgi:glycosyltransferase involved in cell wall biosynthesis